MKKYLVILLVIVAVALSAYVDDVDNNNIRIKPGKIEAVEIVYDSVLTGDGNYIYIAAYMNVYGTSGQVYQLYPEAPQYDEILASYFAE